MDSTAASSMGRSTSFCMSRVRSMSRSSMPFRYFFSSSSSWQRPACLLPAPDRSWRIVAAPLATPCDFSFLAHYFVHLASQHLHVRADLADVFADLVDVLVEALYFLGDAVEPGVDVGHQQADQCRVEKHRNADREGKLRVRHASILPFRTYGIKWFSSFSSCPPGPRSVAAPAPSAALWWFSPSAWPPCPARSCFSSAQQIGRASCRERV